MYRLGDLSTGGAPIPTDENGRALSTQVIPADASLSFPDVMTAPEVFKLAVHALPYFTWKYPVGDEMKFARMITAQSNWESVGFKVCAKSPTGPLGLMQFTQATWKDIPNRIMKEWDGTAFDRPLTDRCVPWWAILYGSAYMASLLQRAKGSWSRAFELYNGSNSYDPTCSAHVQKKCYPGNVTNIYNKWSDNGDYAAMMQAVDPTGQLASNLRVEYR